MTISTKLICPVCESRFTLEQAAREELHRELVELASLFGKNWELVHEYTDCFRQAVHGQIRLAKRVRILRGLWRLFERCEFQVRGKGYRTDWPRILEAMTTVVDAEKYGFKNHNYLKQVMVQGAERLGAEGLTAGEEEERERRRAQRPGRTEKSTDGLQSFKGELGVESLSEHLWGNDGG